MIKKPNNWNEVREYTDKKKLPLDAYVCEIRKAVVQHTDYGEQLCLLFEIVEGDFRDYYTKDFRENTNQDKKWKGVLRQFIPKDDGSERDEWTKSSFKGLVTSVEKSNPGYQWDWDESSLVKKKVGILYRNEEWEYEGKNGWTVRPFRAISVESVRDEDFTLPKDKPLKNKTAFGYQDMGYRSYTNSAPGFNALDESDSDLPF